MWHAIPISRWRQFIQQQPIQTELLHGAGEFAKFDWFADITVGTGLVTIKAVFLFTR